jgi:hypothetical protein
MSNPLLKPNDPRFQKPDLRGAAGENRFGDAEPASDKAAGESIFAAAAVEDARPYDPKYEAHQKSRGGLLLTLAGVGWVCGVLGSFSFTGFFSLGWLLPLLGIVPSAAAWLLAHEELKTIQTGAISDDARPDTRRAYWLGLVGLAICLAVTAAMIWQGLTFLPDLF